MHDVRLNYLGVPIDAEFADLVRHARAELEQLLAYAIDRRPVGYFVRAVLENDLLAAIDTSAFQGWHIRQLVLYVQKNLPAGSFGSPRAVAAWLSHEPAPPAPPLTPEPRETGLEVIHVSLFPAGDCPMAVGR